MLKTRVGLYIYICNICAIIDFGRNNRLGYLTKEEQKRNSWRGYYKDRGYSMVI